MRMRPTPLRSVGAPEASPAASTARAVRSSTSDASRGSSTSCVANPTPTSTGHRESMAPEATDRGAGTLRPVLIDHYLRGALTDAPRVAHELEALGFDGLYTAEAANEPFFSLALAAEHTQRATLFTSIAIGFERNPLALSPNATGIHRLSNGRISP